MIKFDFQRILSEITVQVWLDTFSWIVLNALLKTIAQQRKYERHAKKQPGIYQFSVRYK